MTDAAFRLYVCALSYCAEAREPTGFISAEQADALRRALRKPPKAVAELVTLNAWEAIDGGYLIHDFHVYAEPSSRDRTRAWRERKRDGHVTRGDGHETVTVTNPLVPPPDPPLNPPPNPVPEPVTPPVRPPSPGGPVEKSPDLHAVADVLSGLRIRRRRPRWA